MDWSNAWTGAATVLGVLSVFLGIRWAIIAEDGGRTEDAIVSFTVVMGLFVISVFFAAGLN